MAVGQLNCLLRKELAEVGEVPVADVAGQFHLERHLSDGLRDLAGVIRDEFSTVVQFPRDEADVDVVQCTLGSRLPEDALEDVQRREQDTVLADGDVLVMCLVGC